MSLSSSSLATNANLWSSEQFAAVVCGGDSIFAAAYSNRDLSRPHSAENCFNS